MAASYVNNINQVLKSLCISNESERAMPSHLSTYLRIRIVALWGEGKKVFLILIILESEGRRTLRATVRRCAFCWRTNHGLRDPHGSGRRSKISAGMAAFVEAKLQEDDEVPSVELQRLISRKFSVNISAPTIRRYIRMHLWVVVRTRFGPLISV